MTSAYEYNQNAVSSGYHWVLMEHLGDKGICKWMVHNVSGELHREYTGYYLDAVEYITKENI